MNFLESALIATAREHGATVSGAESCTGGLIAKRLTDVAGSSAVFVGACVTYTNDVKQRMLGVDQSILDTYTEVSHPCAAAMAEGARRAFQTDAAYSTTGYAGPGGGTKDDPVGTVYVGISTEQETKTYRLSLPETSTRDAVRTAAADFVLRKLCEIFPNSKEYDYEE